MTPDTRRFDGRVALITGGAYGIGLETGRRLAAEGARVVVVDRDEEAARRAVAEHLPSGVVVKADVSRKADVVAAVAMVLERLERLDVLVNCAGIFDDTRVDQITEAQWHDVLGVNLTGTFFCCQAAIEPMLRQGYGRIVNLGSIGGKLGGPVSGGNYAASKAAVMCLTKSFARFFAGSGVTVNTVAPGVIDTAMTKDWPAEARERTLGAIPLGRLGTAAEVATAIAFLASEEARYITGETLDVNGGQLMD